MRLVACRADASAVFDQYFLTRLDQAGHKSQGCLWLRAVDRSGLFKGLMPV